MESSGPYIGKIFGNYRISAEIACGSFGCAYLAQHVFLDNIAVIKLLHASHLHSTKERGAFLQEARLLKMLEHPHVLPIYDFGVQNGLPYLVTSYAPGGSLRNDLMRRPSRPLPLRKVVSILTQLGQALSYAHERGVVHRDIKPENILFTSMDQVLLADFGIASVLAQTGQMSLRGTPAYMAPEQFEGEVSTRSDQYVLGCVAYELVTGQKPFSIPTPSLLAMWYQHTKVKPIPPSQINPHVPLHLERAILKAMAKRRELRHADVAAFVRRLYAYPIPGMSMDDIHQSNYRGPLQKPEEHYVSVAKSFYSLKRYEKALEAYEQAICLDPQLITAYFGKGNVLFSTGRYEEALTAYEQAARLTPEDASIHCQIGEVLSHLGRSQEATAAYERAMHLDLHFAEAWRDRNNVQKIVDNHERSRRSREIKVPD